MSAREALWFLGTLVRPKLDAADTGGAFALWEGELPRHAAPPLHSHPQAETFYVVAGEVTAWSVTDPGTWDAAVPPAGTRCGPGDVFTAPGGVAHTFRVESDTARMLFLSVPAGIEEMVRGLAEPARWPWLQPPPDGVPRVSGERMAAVEQATGMVRCGASPRAGGP